MSRHSSGPSPLLIVVIGALLVFGGYYVWIGFLQFLEDQGDITADVTREARITATAQSRQPVSLPTIYVPATLTPLPPCQNFYVSVERAVYRECPAQDDRECPVRDIILEGTELCIYDRVPNNQEWYVVELNPGGTYRDLVYIHQSVVRASDPTLTPTITFTPLPTITAIPTETVLPSPTPSRTPTLDPAVSPTPSPTPTPPPSRTPSPTPPQVLF